MPDKDPRYRFTEINTDESFNTAALKLFREQAQNVSVYREYINHIGIDPLQIESIDQIPFLPVELFKHKKVISDHHTAHIIFESSGTTGSVPSRHYITDSRMYDTSLLECFRLFYGSPADYCIFALLPSYLERGNSSLVYMADKLIRLSNYIESGFYLNEYKTLAEQLTVMKYRKVKVLLLGVTFALLEFARQYTLDFEDLIVMETGGMKGRGEEPVREEVHKRLCDSFAVKTIHSEYGMTEILSQAYSNGNGKFRTPPWMKIMIREMNDPFSLAPTETAGGINIIDLANADSCAFISTMDIGRLNYDQSFVVLGRYDYSDVRGCNLLFT